MYSQGKADQAYRTNTGVSLLTGFVDREKRSQPFLPGDGRRGSCARVNLRVNLTVNLWVAGRFEGVKNRSFQLAENRVA